MKPRLLTDMNEQAAKNLEAEYLGSATYRDKLSQILLEEINKSIKEMRDAVSNNIQNLPEFYAQELAKQKAYQYILTYIQE